jgi:hypothetical protein
VMFMVLNGRSTERCRIVAHSKRPAHGKSLAGYVGCHPIMRQAVSLLVP